MVWKDLLLNKRQRSHSTMPVGLQGILNVPDSSRAASHGRKSSRLIVKLEVNDIRVKSESLFDGSIRLRLYLDRE